MPFCLPHQVDVTNRTQEVDLSNYVPNGEWELLEARINRNVVYYRSGTSSTTGQERRLPGQGG